MCDEYDDFICFFLHELLHHEYLVLSIELVGSLIHDDDITILEEHPDEGYDLSLATRELDIIAHIGIELIFGFSYLVPESELVEIAPYHLICNRCICSEEEILPQGRLPVHDIGYLCQERYMLRKYCRFPIDGIVSIEQDLSLISPEKSRNQMHECCFSGSIFANYPIDRSTTQSDIDVIEDERVFSLTIFFYSIYEFLHSFVEPVIDSDGARAQMLLTEYHILSLILCQIGISE